MFRNNSKLSKRPGTNKSIVLVGGCFDILHFGHISFLTQAKSYGDFLLVALESDKRVKRLKNEKRPIHTQQIRKRMLLTLRCVDEVVKLPVMKSDKDYTDFVKAIAPSVIAVTEGDPIENKKRKQARSVGGTLVVIPKIHTPSTSQLARLIGLE